MQCGPFASSETTATSQGRARYAAATHPHGSPSSASSSKMVVVVGLPWLSALAGTDIPHLPDIWDHCNPGASYSFRPCHLIFGSTQSVNHGFSDTSMRTPADCPDSDA